MAVAGIARADAQETVSLARLASAKGLFFGAAVSSPILAADPQFANLVASQASMLVAEGEMKRNTVQPTEGVWNFKGGDALLAFAEQHHQKLRGHTLVWYNSVPPWIEQALAESPKESILLDMVSKSCSHFRGKIHSWDVVNELVEPPEGHPDGLRTKSVWYQAFGENYIAAAFHAAKEADPHALLCYGEYGIEMRETWQERRRTAVLKLIEKLKKKNVPIEAFGVQGHLKPFREHFDENIYIRFLKEIEGFGLKLMITELDAVDVDGPSDVSKRDAEIASAVRRFLDASLANSAMLGVLTWGLSDRYSWLSQYPKYKRNDGTLSRGLPFDSELKPKPMRDAIAAAFQAK